MKSSSSSGYLYGSAAAMAFMFLFGCANGTTSQPSTQPGVDRVRVESSSGLFVGGSAAELKLTFGKTPLHDFSLAANRKEVGVWGIRVPVSAEMATDGSGVVAVGSEGSGVGRVEISKAMGTPLILAENGTAEIAFANGRVSGTVGVTPVQLNGTFSGDLIVACWVPASEMPGAQPSVQGTVSEDGQEALVLDSGFSHAKCKPFRAIAGL